MTSHIDTDLRAPSAVGELPARRGAEPRLTRWPALSTAGRVVYSVPFAMFGLLHLLNAPAMAPAVRIAGGVFWIFFTGVALIAGSLGMLTGLLGRWASLGIAALLMVFILLV